MGMVRNALTETGLAAQFLQIEITESAAMQDITLTTRILDELSAFGVQVAIDDFGSGYSSLGYLKQFPVNMLKIDRSFIRDVLDDDNDAAITTAIIVMAHVLDLDVVAEGVETEEQLAFLIPLQCDLIQGYLASRAVPPDRLIQLIEKKQGILLEVSWGEYA
ncbi:MAG TPA: EAL domain-containing protein [bacterium]|nr:EAL domain-containing protein [bacterium]